MLNKLNLDLDRQTAQYGALALRIGLGVVFIAHGLLKLLVFTPAGTASFFEAQGFPGWTAYPVMIIELVGGAAMILGFYTRIWALLFVGVLIGASTVHFPNGWSFDKAGGGWEYPVFLILASFVQLLLGNGAFALSNATNKRDQTANKSNSNFRAAAS